MASYVETLYKSSPPAEICTYDRQELSAIGEFNLKSISRLLEEMKEKLHDNTILSTEIQMIRVLIYKVKAVFRNDKQLSALSKVRRCVKRVLEMQLPETAEKLNQQLKAAFDSSNVTLKSENFSSTSVRLPSRQMFEFLQVQIQAMALLLVCTLKSICSAHRCGLHKLYAGHFVPINVVISSTLSRLWVLFKDYLSKCIDLYQKLLPFLKILKGSQTEWFPANEKFPVDLSQWLNIDSLQQIDEETL